MVMTDFKTKVEIRQFRACAFKNMQHNTYLRLNRLNFNALQEIWVEEHDGDAEYK